MFDRISRSWTLVKASASVLRDEKELLLFPLISFASLLAVLVSFAVPAWRLGVLDALSHRGHAQPGGYLLAFLFYFVQYFVIVFFNAGLVGAAMMRLEGGNPTFKDGMRIAASRLWVIAGYAAIAATVGTVLRAIQERVGFVGRIVVGLLGVAWSVATFLVVPVIVARRDMGPVEAVKESAYLLRSTWGENLLGQAGIGAAFALVYLAVGFCGLFLFVVAGLGHDVRLFLLAGAATLLGLGAAALVHSALSGIYEAALYRFATQGEAALGFDAADLQRAFRAK
ncbi:MAG TPA: DUF6159 family protein [Usitatibacter sp.]|nr:DUF6159 family protein [Usitatibacter sp.]